MQLRICDAIVKLAICFGLSTETIDTEDVQSSPPFQTI